MSIVELITRVRLLCFSYVISSSFDVGEIMSFFWLPLWILLSVRSTAVDCVWLQQFHLFDLHFLLSGLLEELNDMNSKLEDIQRSLDMYLETKRQIFPRFYFISNDDLLEILGQSKNPMEIQPHLKKCFDNIKSLTMVKVCTDDVCFLSSSLLLFDPLRRKAKALLRITLRQL